jgi:UDP-N-acetylglucosamine 2-epimerase (non-hydrolysing)
VVGEYVLIHTGQIFDPSLNAVFFEELAIRKPDYQLAVDTRTLGTTLADTLRKSEEVLSETHPDAVLILGDTNSAIAAVMARRMGIPVYHMEAGNRCFDERVPEEINRRLVDHVADFNLAYTENARRNLLAEGLHPSRITVTGSPMREVLNHYRAGIDGSDILQRMGLSPDGYFLVSMHRQENVDPPERLAAVLDCLGAVLNEWSIPVIVSTHPRTRQRLESSGIVEDFGGIRFHQPFGYFDYNKLQISARCVLSDSGSVSEESAILGFDAITLRDSIERPEAVDTASIMVCGLRPAEVVNQIRTRLAVTSRYTDSVVRKPPAEYDICDTSLRVINFIWSTFHATGQSQRKD